LRVLSCGRRYRFTERRGRWLVRGSGLEGLGLWEDFGNGLLVKR
jgi:hypothetical protein